MSTRGRRSSSSTNNNFFFFFFSRLHIYHHHHHPLSLLVVTGWHTCWAMLSLWARLLGCGPQGCQSFCPSDLWNLSNPWTPGHVTQSNGPSSPCYHLHSILIDILRLHPWKLLFWKPAQQVVPLSPLTSPLTINGNNVDHLSSIPGHIIINTIIK